MDRNISLEEFRSVLDEIWKEVDSKIHEAESKSKNKSASEYYCSDMKGYSRGLSHARHSIILRLEKRFLEDKG